MGTQKKPDKIEKRRNSFNLYQLALIVALAFLLISLYSLWKYGSASWIDIGVMIAIIAIPIVFARFPALKKQMLSIIGEKRPIQRWSFRLILPIPFILPFVFFLLLSGVDKSVPPALQWSVIALAPTLGGLVLVGAGNRRIKRGAYFELISVAQKLIVATVFFILFTCLFFTVELTGGIDTNLLDLSLMGCFRAGSFWFSVAFFFAGVYLFLVAIIDLVLALRRIMP